MNEPISNSEPQYTSDSSDQTQQKRRNESFVGLWFDDPTIAYSDMYETIMIRLQATFEYVRVFDNILSFTSYICNEQLVAHVVVIISYELHVQSMCELIVQRAKTQENKFRGPYVLLFEQINTPIEHHAFRNIDELLTAITSNSKCHLQHESLIQSEFCIRRPIDECKSDKLLPLLGVWNSPLKPKSIRYLSNESRRFIQFQALIEILLRIQHDEEIAKDDMLADCRKYYHTDTIELRKINRFKENYCAADVISYYTEDSFCFRMVNMALRTEDIERIFTYRLFITDLHNELTKRTEQKRHLEETIVLYRGKKLPNIILQLLKDNKGKLISMNGFLSTTKNEDTAKVFSGDDVSRDGYTSIIFKLHVHKFTNYTGKPFADISNDENEVDDEQEVLFSLGTVWRIENVQQIDHLWYVTLTNCTDLDDELCEYLTRLTDGYSLLSIGNLLQELDENDKAENFYRRTLQNDPNITDEQKGLLYFRIGMLRDKKKDHFGALDYLTEAIKHFSSCVFICEEEISSTMLRTNTSIGDRLAIYFNIGVIHRRNQNLKEAQEAWEHASIQEGSPENLANVNSCLGELAYDRSQYEQAEIHHQKALQFINQSSAKEEIKQKFKRKYEQFIQWTDQIDENLKKKRQRTTDSGQPTGH